MKSFETLNPRLTYAYHAVDEVEYFLCLFSVLCIFYNSLIHASEMYENDGWLLTSHRKIEQLKVEESLIIYKEQIRKQYKLTYKLTEAEKYAYRTNPTSIIG